MKKIYLTSSICMMMACPAMADIALNNDNPTCDSSTIGASSGSTALDAVWNIVNQTCSAGQYFDMTTATCVTCTANSYCPGGTYNVESQTNGLNSCPSGYGLSASGAGAQTDCYRNCTTSDVAHSTGVTGGYYYGDNNQCAATSCAAGWHLNEGINIASEFATTNPENASYAYVNGSGVYKGFSDLQQSETGLTQPMTWVLKLDGIGMLYGSARCSKTPGTNDDYWTNPTTFDSLTDGTGDYCYCNITGYKPVDGDVQALSSPWVFYQGYSNASSCTKNCASGCGNNVHSNSAFRSAIFGAVAPSLASCEANTINITWYNEGEIHDENTCTYAESVTLPETDPQRTGYNFTGWTVRPASTPTTTE